MCIHCNERNFHEFENEVKKVEVSQLTPELELASELKRELSLSDRFLIFSGTVRTLRKVLLPYPDVPLFAIESFLTTRSVAARCPSAGLAGDSDCGFLHKHPPQLAEPYRCH